MELKLVEPNGYDYLEASVHGRSITIEVYEPWAGDTETGFGRGGTVTLSTQQAKELAEFLFAALAQQE
jgi:hypothetical protein